MDLSNSELVKKVTEWLEEKKAENIKVYDVRSRSDYTDMIIVCEGSGDLHNRALADNVAAHAKESGVYVMGKEGLEAASWILIDLASVVVHIFDHETRTYYDIEKLWKVSDQIKSQNEAEQTPQ